MCRNGLLSTCHSTRIQVRPVNHHLICPQAQYEAILKEQKILRDGIDTNKYYAKEFKQRADEKKALSEEENKKRTKATQKEKVRKKMIRNSLYPLIEDI